jgi:acetyl esterase
MPLDPQVKRFLKLLHASAGPGMEDMTVAERREGLVALMRLAGPPVQVARVEERTVPGAESPLPVRIYTPTGTTDPLLPGLVYFHGGGFVAGTLDTHDGTARALAEASGCRLVSVDYRLAPEHRFPAALEDAVATVTYIGANLQDFGIDPKRFGISGDSAGGNLAAAACQALARAQGPPIALQVLLCPILDYSPATDSRRELASGYLTDEATFDHDLRYYLPAGVDVADPRLSPLRTEDLSGLPRAVIHTAEFDPLRDEGRLYFERMTRAGVQVSYTCHGGMIHLFYALGGAIPYARTAITQIGAEIRAAMA